MIIPVLLCGGSGTRLWPLSRKQFPKQFIPILGQESLFQASARRFAGSEFSDPLIITSEDFRFIVLEQLEEIGIKPMEVLIEPEGRNTAPAAVVAALRAHQIDNESFILLAPSDHSIDEGDSFCQTILQGMPAAQDNKIVTFGIVPTRAETGYGWLEAGKTAYPGVQNLKNFIEKPNLEKASELLKNKDCLWNAGVFLVKSSQMLESFKTHAPEVLNVANAALNLAKSDLGFTRIDSETWAQIPDISIDYAIMEKADNISVVRYDNAWSDLGSWGSVWQETPKDANGNGVSNNALALNCENSLLRSETSEVELVGIGLNNIVAIATHDAVMVADISDTQNVKKAVNILHEKGVKQAVQSNVDHRPWGWYETLVLADRFQVKRIHVHPGAALSLQSHVHRSEHWIVVAGTARVTVDDTVTLLSENQSIYIPLGAVHRMENPGKVPMVLIEVQTGSYLGEDDIIRYEDIYARK